MPVNWYAALVIIVILGVASVAFARYNYAKGGPAPVINQTWHGGLATDVCGTVQPDLPVATATSTNGLVAAADGVMVISPKTSSQSGNNATLGKFASEQKGMTLTDSSLTYPGKVAKTYTNGEKCPSGTPDAGKKGFIQVRSWILSASKGSNGSFVKLGGKVAPSASGLKLLDRQLVTIGFVPSGTNLAAPSSVTIKALTQALEGTSPPVTTTTAAPSTSTTVPATATTVAPATTTTTSPPSTTTTKPPATTTTKPKK